jgi:hypothetical protein
MFLEKENAIKLPNDPDISAAVIKELASAMIDQAVRDLRSKFVEKQFDAAVFLAGPNLPLWLGAAIEEDPTELINSGVELLIKGRERIKTKGKK